MTRLFRILIAGGLFSFGYLVFLLVSIATGLPEWIMFVGPIPHTIWAYRHAGKIIRFLETET